MIISVATHNCVSGHAEYCASAISLICFLWPQTWFLYFLISYQLLIKPLLYAQAFVFKTFHIFSPVSTSLSHEIIIETPLTSKKCRKAKFCLIDAWNKSLLFTGDTSFFSRFFNNISEISTNIKKPAKY